jgi:hypothetical protein
LTRGKRGVSVTARQNSSLVVPLRAEYNTTRTANRDQLEQIFLKFLH